MERHRGVFIFVICFLRSCQVSHSIGLTFDNQLVIVTNDCYTRVAIGSKLPDADVFSSVAVRSISECEEECSKKRNSCNSFAFGIGIKGNGTCALSAKMPKPEDLQSHADYDVYMKSQRSPLCEPDRLYKMGNGGVGQEKRNDTRPTTRFGGGLFGPPMPSILSSPRPTGGVTPNDPLYQRGYTSSFDDERRISDILRNRNPTLTSRNPFGSNQAKIDNYNDLPVYSNRKSIFGQRNNFDPNNGRLDFRGPSFQNPVDNVNHLASHLDNDLHTYKALTVYNGPFDAFSRPIFVHDDGWKNKSPTDFGFWSSRDPTKHRNAAAHRPNQNQGFFNNAHKSQGIVARAKQNDVITGNYNVGKVTRPGVSSSYNFETNGAKLSSGGLKDISDEWSPIVSTAFRGFGARINEKPKSCYRRLLSGKKSLDLHVRRALECERIEDCHRACDYEKLFTCEGFNYRRIGHAARGMCELTSVPYSRMDLHRDFVSDPQCDYYEKDPNCLANAPAARPTWWNQQARPSQSYGPSYSSNGRPDTRPYIPDRRPLNQAPRPLDYDRRPTHEIPRPLDYAHRPIDHDRRPPVIHGDQRVLYDDAFDHRGYHGANRDGYPTRPEDQFGYSGRFPPRRPLDDDFYNRNLPWSRYPNRRIDHGPTHDIGTNEIGPYLPEHRKDPNHDWGAYSTVYGGSYGYDTNYVGKFDMPKYYPKPQPKPPQPKPSRPYDNEHFYGEFYNYGGAFGYGDNYMPVNQDPLYGGIGRAEECSVRAGAGFRLSRGVVRKTYLTPNLDQCESLCVNEKSYVCMSFSYRYNVAPTDPTDNCLLSDVSYRDLNFYTDLEPDRDYDIYAMIANSGTCGTKKEPSQRPLDECFWRVRSGFGMPTDVVKKTVTVGNLGECQVECTIAQDFTCRSFAFKYGLEQEPQDILMNCYLSDWPSQDINPVNMPDMDGAELYERGSFGRGCQPYAVPFFNMGRFDGKQSSHGDEVCYSGYNKPCKLTPYAALSATYVNSEQDCRQKCSRMRESDSVPCMSYSYKLTIHGTEENCLLSDVPIRDLRPGLDYIYDDDHVLYAWKDLDPRCLVTGYPAVDDDRWFGSSGPLRPLLPAPSRPDFDPGNSYPSDRPDNIYPDPRPFFATPKPNRPYYATRPFDPDKPDSVGPYRPDAGYGSYDKFGYATRPGGPGAHGSGSFYPNEYSAFRYYTVNGVPCKKGTKCQKNKIAGFWACETEGSEYGSWDYCCAPTHHCGYSQGYNYPWCYVGAVDDQWRPCSDKYFPYLPSPRPVRPPMINGDDRYHGPRPVGSYDIPGYYGRHWPITYLHREPPPNCTDSLASADSSANRRRNETTPSTVEKSSSTPISTTAIENDTVTARTRRRRLRSRTVLHAGDQGAITSRRTIIRVINETQGQRERVAKIERASKRIESFTAPTAITAITAPLAAAAVPNRTNAKLERTDDEAERGGGGTSMIRVPLIAPNISLPLVN